MKVSMFQWVGGTPCPEWFKDREVVEMTEDEFYSKLKELTKFKYTVQVGTRKKPATAERGIYVMTYVSSDDKGHEYQMLAIDDQRFTMR